MKQRQLIRTCMWIAWINTACIILFMAFKPNQNTMKTISAFLHQQVDHSQTPSIQYAIFDADSVIYETHTGVSNVKTGALADANTTYHLYSITKTVTAVVILQLAAEGRIDLHAPVKQYLPNFMYDDRITVIQLLNHTSGIPNPMPLKWIHTIDEHIGFDRNAFFDKVMRDHRKLDFEPGTKFQYSNLEYIILGQLIEKVTGQSYEDAATERIMAKSGINTQAMHFTIDPHLHATGYHPYWSFMNAVLGLMIDKSKYMEAREGKWKPFKPFYNNGTAYGGLLGSATGLRQYGQALLKKDSPLLSGESKQLLFEENAINSRGTGMALSWFAGQLNGHRYVAHAGGGGGYYTELRLYPDLGIGSLIMYNRSGMRDERMLDKADLYFIKAKEEV